MQTDTRWSCLRNFERTIFVSLLSISFNGIPLQMKEKYLIRLTGILAVLIVAHSCTNKAIPVPALTDTELFSLITSSGYTYYQGGSVLTSSPPGPHGSFALRFNSIAASVLDTSGELPPGGVFPVGSILVKELHAGGEITEYAVMKKDPSGTNAGGGWLWAEYSPDGSVAVSVTSKGLLCVSCHSMTPNRDLTRVFDLH